MFRNLSKVVLVSMLIVAVVSSISFATTSRVRSLANTGDYISDDSNVHRWLSTLPSYGNQVNAEIGQYFGLGSLSSTRGLSWTFATEEYGTFRITLNENQIDSPGFWMTNPFYTSFTPSAVTGSGSGKTSTPINRFDIGHGYEFGENHTIGWNVTRSSWSSTRSDSVSDSNSFTTFGVGYSWSNNEDLVADFLFNYGMGGGEIQRDTPSSVTNQNTSLMEYDSKGGINIAARAMWDWKDDITVPVNAEFVSVDYSTKTERTFTTNPTPLPGTFTIPSGDKISGFRAGAGVNVDVNTSNMFVMAVEFTNLKWEYSNPDTLPDTNTASVAGLEVTATVLPTIRMALETSINSWLTTRVGAARHQYKIKVKRNNRDDTDYNDGTPGGVTPSTPSGPPNVGNWQAFEWFLGCGFNVAEWTIDLELADETPFSFGYWLTGYSAFPTASQGPVSRISAVYNY